MVLPVLAVAAAAPTGPPAGSAVSGGSDEEQVAAAPAPLRPLLVASARRFALPPALLTALAKIESGFDPAAVGPAVEGGPALGLMQFLPSTWRIFNQAPGATPLEPAAAIDAAARHLLASGALPGGAWDAAQALLGYNHSAVYVRDVLAQAAVYGYRYSPQAPPLDPSRYVFPLRGAGTYGAYHHDYPATDVFAPIGTPVLACVRAQVLRVSRTDTGKGGLSVTLRGEDGWRYYYAHLSAVAPVLRIGQVVEARAVMGASGDTGDARGTDPHLHFGVSRSGNAQGQVSPYPYLQVWRRA
jgi:murein DD-endopeptidase MepM/ murein hydrolase activator NlpD